MADLRDLGLSDYEARAYRGLLTIGQTTARELSEESGVPMGRVYDVLNDLETRGVVRSQAAARPTTYVAVDPETALDRLLEARREDLAARADAYTETVAALKRDLDTGTVHDEGFWTAAVGTGSVVDLLCERIAAADDTVVMIAGPPSTGFDLDAVGQRLTDRLADAVTDGVAVQVLAAYELADSLPATLGDRYRSLVADHDAFEVRVSGDATGAVTVIDAAEVCVEVPNPVEPDRAFAMIDLTDREFAADVLATFEDRWDAATPL